MKKLFATLVTLSLITTTTLATNMQAFACEDCEVAAEITATMPPGSDSGQNPGSRRSSAPECEPGPTGLNDTYGDSDPSLDSSFAEGATLDDHVSATDDHGPISDAERELVENPCSECEFIRESIRESRDSLFIDRPSPFCERSNVRWFDWEGPIIGYMKGSTIYCPSGHAVTVVR